MSVMYKAVSLESGIDVANESETKQVDTPRTVVLGVAKNNNKRCKKQAITFR